MSTPLEVMKGRKTIEKIKEDVEAEYEMGGLSDGLYGSYAEDVSKRLTLYLLQALHDELEGKKRKVWSELEFSKLGFMEMHQAGTDVSYNQAIKDQQDNLQALMDKYKYECLSQRSCPLHNVQHASE